jgi:hypothetical protein
MIKNNGQYYHQKMRYKKYYSQIQSKNGQKLTCRDLFDHTRYDIIPLQHSQLQHIISPLISLEYITTYWSIRAFQHSDLSIYLSKVRGKIPSRGKQPLHGGKASSRGDVFAGIDEASRKGTQWGVGDVARSVAVEFFRHRLRQDARTKNCEGGPLLWDSSVSLGYQVAWGMDQLLCGSLGAVLQFFRAWRGFSLREWVFPLTLSIYLSI